MKKTIFIFVVFSLLLSACYASSNSPSEDTSDRDLSTPSSRLVGQWRPEYHDYDYYFTAIDPNTGEGKMTAYHREKGDTLEFVYWIVEESRIGKNIEIFTMSIPDKYFDDDPEYMYFDLEDRLDHAGALPSFKFKLNKDGMTGIMTMPGGDHDITWISKLTKP